jgi:hypothetical protein
MEKQESSIEWLFKELLNSEPNILEWNKLLEQAKEMEKQQMIEFAYYYSNERIDLKDLNYEYEQTFGGKDE